jgi:hypothetical protein
MSDLNLGEYVQRRDDDAAVFYAAKDPREGTTRFCACDL